MTRKKAAKRVRRPKDLSGNGAEELFLKSYYHAHLSAGTWARIQINGEGPLWLDNPKEIRKLSQWLNQAADYLEHREKRRG